MWGKTQDDDPVILTLSSDEEEEGGTTANHRLSDTDEKSLKNQPPQRPVNPKEPVILPNHGYENFRRVHQNFPGIRFEELNTYSNNEFISLQCRNIRIGSYKVVPHDKVTLSYKGMKVDVPPFAEGESDPVSLLFPIQGTLKVLAHFAGPIYIFFYVTDAVASIIRTQLKMNDKNGFYFCPSSKEESQKRVAITVEVMKLETANIIRNLLNFGIDDGHGKMENMFEELSEKEANEIFVRSSTGDHESEALNSRSSKAETNTLLLFPPPPHKGGITITTDDYWCLKEEQFLNDVLVDFFLKWLHTSHLSDVDRERTHIFSTFFYKRLTFKPKNNRCPPISEEESKLTAAQRRHARVQSWTKNVDIFSKDFILIPINEKSHWFLAVICFPFLDGPVRMRDSKPVARSEATAPTRVSSRIKKKVEIPLIDDDNWSDRDEAEGDDNELDDDDDGEFNCFDEFNSSGKVTKDEEREPIKQPCILILDSLSGGSRTRIVNTLREYLLVEYHKRKKGDRVFSKETIQGHSLKVPQQMNYSDCGLFTLQFAQSFFEKPLTDYHLPIRHMTDWFNQDVVACKRESIANLIKSLMDQFKPDHGITLPTIFFNSNNTQSDVNLLDHYNETKNITPVTSPDQTTTDKCEPDLVEANLKETIDDSLNNPCTKDKTVKTLEGSSSSNHVTQVIPINDSKSKDSPTQSANNGDSPDITGCSGTIRYIRESRTVSKNKDETTLKAKSENITRVEKKETAVIKENSKNCVNSATSVIKFDCTNSKEATKKAFGKANVATTQETIERCSSLQLLHDSYTQSDDDEIFVNPKKKCKASPVES